MGGLILIAVVFIWFCVTLWLARKITGWLPIRSTIKKMVVSVSAFALIFPLPLIDEIIGKIQFDKLCREEAGVKIFGKLELGPEFFNADGTPNFIDPASGNISERIDPYIKFVREPSQYIPSIAKLTRGRFAIHRRADGKILLERIDFGIDGGWLAYDNRSWLWKSGCPQNKQGRDQLLTQIIVQN